MPPVSAGQRTIRLQTSLEAVATLGEGYLLVGAGREWSARERLVWLRREPPTLLTLPVTLVLPDARGGGAILEVDLEGEAIVETPLFRLEPRLSLVFPR